MIKKQIEQNIESTKAIIARLRFIRNGDAAFVTAEYKPIDEQIMKMEAALKILNELLAFVTNPPKIVSYGDEGKIVEDDIELIALLNE